MSGDVQTRQRRKEKKKQKREEEISTVPGVDTSKFNESEKKSVQMHVQESDHHGDHGAGICAKIVFFSLMVILLGLVTLIVFENRGGSDVDTPLSESRFSEYLQGWVDENREDDHHDEPHFHASDDSHDDEDHGLDDSPDGSPLVPDGEPYPEEKDVSNPEDDDHEESAELNAEINNNADESEQDNEPDQDGNDDQEDNDSNDNDADENENDLNQNSNEIQEDDNENNDQDENDDDDVPNLFEDSAPFEEEKGHVRVKRAQLEKQVDELYETYNEIAEMLGKDKIDTNNARITKRDASKDDDDENNSNNQENLEDVIDNDAGEDLLLQKLAEESENVQQSQENESNNDDQEEEESSSLLVKTLVGALLALVAHQIIIKKISATNRIESELNASDDLLSKRRFTMLSSSEERLVSDENLGDNEEIIEVMMISRPTLVSGSDEGEFEDEEFSEELEEEEEEELEGEEEEEGEEYSDEMGDEIYNPPQTFDDFKNMYRSQPEHTEEVKRKVTFNESQPVVEKEVEAEMEERILNVSSTSSAKEHPVELNNSEEKPSPTDYEEEKEPNIEIEEEILDEEEEIEEDVEEIEEEEEEPSGEDLIDEDDLEYDESEEDISEIDDSELMKRLEAKYGKIDDKSADEDDASWTKLPETGGAQSYMEEFLKQQTLEENPLIKMLYDEAKTMDEMAEKEKSNKKLLAAIESYKELLNVYGDKLNDTTFKEVATRCIERMRFMGKLKQAVDIHYKLIHRFVDDPSVRNQLAVTYLLGNRLSVAKLVLHEVLSRWRSNGFALVHYGFVLKNLDQDYENAVIYLREGIESNEPGTQDGRFYFNLGDALQRLGRNDEALEVYKKGAKIGLFLSEYQRSLYNVDRLKSRPFWTKVETTYKDDLMEIHMYWQIIRDEGLKLLSQDGTFTNEQENLKDVGDWKQFELFARGAATKHCHLAPITCKLINKFKAASTCKRGQVKFSVLHPNTHIHSHCGPTNCRIRAHLGLKVPENTFIRVADETRSWKDGEWLIFDDSFEHEVWHNGTGIRLVLIVDVWHPDLTEDEKRSLSPI